MKTLGYAALCALLAASFVITSACRTPAGVYVKPYYCESYRAPTDDGRERLREYKGLRDAGIAPRTRAWIREANRICEANNALRED